MKAQQQTAYEHPCREAEETRDQRFYRTVLTHGRYLSAGLTFNVGLE